MYFYPRRTGKQEMAHVGQEVTCEPRLKQDKSDLEPDAHFYLQSLKLSAASLSSETAVNPKFVCSSGNLHRDAGPPSSVRQNILQIFESKQTFQTEWYDGNNSALLTFSGETLMCSMFVPTKFQQKVSFAHVCCSIIQ